MSQELASPIEIHFKDQIYNVSSFPSSFEDLISQIKQHFNTLPKSWSLQYEDHDGDRIMLVHNEDFEALAELRNSSDHLKIYIIQKDTDCIVLEHEEYEKKSSHPSDNQSMESYNVLEDQADENQNKLDQTDSSEVISFDSPKSNNSSIIQEIIDKVIESPEKQMLELPAALQDQIKTFIFPTKAFMMEQSSQTDTNEKQDQSILKESGSQTNEMIKELTEDKIVQTNNHALANEDKGFQFNSEEYNDNGRSNESPEKIISLESSVRSECRPNTEFGYIMLRSHGSGEEESQYLTNQDVKNEEHLGNTLKSSMRSSECLLNEDLDMKSLVMQTVSANLPQIALLVKDQLEKSAKSDEQEPKKEKPTHNQCYCDGCGMCPIVGIRYRCSVCEDFDYCESCEATKDHEHLFLKIKTPEEYMKIEKKKSKLLGDYASDFDFSELGKKIKEMKISKAVSSTYDTFPEQAMNALNKLIKSIKKNIKKLSDDNKIKREDD